MVVNKPKSINRGNINLNSFLNDMRLIQTQLKDPDLDKPSFDVGNSAVTNYLLWLVLAEMMIMNNRGAENA